MLFDIRLRRRNDIDMYEKCMRSGKLPASAKIQEENEEIRRSEIVKSPKVRRSYPQTPHLYVTILAIQ